MPKQLTLAILGVLLTASYTAAQDIPLSQILVEGEGWKEAAQGSFQVPPVVGNKAGGYYAILDNKLEGKTATDKLKLTLPEKLLSPSGLALWPDGGTLVVGDAKGKHLWAFRCEKDGTLTAGEPYYALRLRRGEKESHVTAIAVDGDRLVYAATPLGVQVFDPTGRLCGIIAKPAGGELTGMTLGGDDKDTLLVSCGDKVYSRHIKVQLKPK